MNSQKTTETTSIDILALLEKEEISTPIDPLNTLGVTETFSEKKESLLVRLAHASLPKIRFALYYMGISSVVFAVLLTSSNWNSYYSVLQAYVNPGALQDSKNDILSVLEKTRVTVYASAEETHENKEERKEQEESLRKKLEESSSLPKEDIFSPKRLIPSEAKVNIDLDITPYDNRIIIPKIGKNIPLVDVRLDAGFDFEHIENIFMKELEKGIVRYPGTAKPGEAGNSFIFGHSSNYPWMKGEYNSVFALLDELSFGDEIIVYYNQKKFVYVIREKKIVKPGNVKVLDRDPTKKELSLMTCWPLGTTLNRLIVFAELTEQK